LSSQLLGVWKHKSEILQQFSDIFLLADCAPDSIYYSIFIKSDYGELVSRFFVGPLPTAQRIEKCKQIIFLTLKLSINFATARLS